MEQIVKMQFLLLLVIPSTLAVKEVKTDGGTIKIIDGIVTSKQSQKERQSISTHYGFIIVHREEYL
jgi:hypothetical protein